MKYTIKQTKNNECGSSCVKMMLAYYYQEERFLDLALPASLNNFNVMKKEMEKFNFETEGVNIQDSSYLDTLDHAIAQIKYQNNEHFVIFIKKKKNKIYLFDPELGERILSKEDYLEISKGNYLIFKEKGEYQLEEENLLPSNMKNLPYLLTYIISCLIDFLLIYILTYMNNSFLRLSLLMLGIISNFILKIIAITSFDKHLESTLIKPILGEKDNVKRIESRVKLKAHIIEYNFKFISYVFALLFICVLLISDHIYNLALILLNIIFISCKEKILKNRKIRIQEEMIANEKNVTFFNEPNYNSLKKSSSKLMINIICFYIIYFVFNVFLSFFIIYLENIHSFTHFIFILITSVSLFEISIKLIAVNDKNEENIHKLKTDINTLEKPKNNLK